MVAEYPFPFSSLGGSYVGVEPMGLVWSMKLSAGQEKASRRLAKWDVTRPYVVNVDVLDGHSHPVEGGEGNAIGRTNFEINTYILHSVLLPLHVWLIPTTIPTTWISKY